MVRRPHAPRSGGRSARQRWGRSLGSRPGWRGLIFVPTRAADSARDARWTPCGHLVRMIPRSEIDVNGPSARPSAVRRALPTTASIFDQSTGVHHALVAIPWREIFGYDLGTYRAS
jgi:hypothetical protein